MSFSHYKDVIEENDTVILYLNINSMHAIQVHPRIKNKKGDFVDNVFQTTYGALKVSSLIGQKFGTKVQLSRGWAYVLHPTPELWTLTLPHRTQIIYTPDISMIILQLEVKPGSILVESGNIFFLFIHFLKIIISFLCWRCYCNGNNRRTRSRSHIYIRKECEANLLKPSLLSW